MPAWAGGRSWEFLCFVSTEDAEHQGYCVLCAHAASTLMTLGEQGGAGWFQEQHFQPLTTGPEPRSQHSVQKGRMRRGCGRLLLCEGHTPTYDEGTWHSLCATPSAGERRCPGTGTDCQSGSLFIGYGSGCMQGVSYPDLVGLLSKARSALGAT